MCSSYTTTCQRYDPDLLTAICPAYYNLDSLEKGSPPSSTIAHCSSLSALSHMLNDVLHTWHRNAFD